MLCSLTLSQDVEVGDSPVLSMCVVRDKVWMGFEIGYLMMFDTTSKRPHVQVHKSIVLLVNISPVIVINVANKYDYISKLGFPCWN